MTTPACDLARMFGSLADAVPDGPPGYGEFIFHEGVLPDPPASLSTDRIVFRKLWHEYDSWYKADAVWMYLSPLKCREFGTFLLACAFHGSEENCTLELTHPESDIKRIIVRRFARRLDNVGPGLTELPYALRYYPARTERLPWLHDCCTHDLPLIALTNAADCVGPKKEDWEQRDTLLLFATDPGTIRLAELFLNAGCSWNEVRDTLWKATQAFEAWRR